MLKHTTLALTALALVVTACVGRDPAVTERNEDAVIVPPPPPPPPPPPEIRTLGSKRLFGTMPVENRFQDPLMTFSGFPWFGYSNDQQSYAVLVRQVGPSPTQTPFVRVGGEENPAGATILGALKTATTPLHTEIWIGRDGDGASFDSMDILLLGVFVGNGEAGVQLEVDEASRVDVDGRTWAKFTADIDSGPLGWSFLVVSDETPGTTFYFGGPVGVDLDLANPGTALHLAAKRPATERESRFMADASSRMRNLAVATPKPRAVVR